jgi:RNA polymerase sigma-70 factor (ECF subfamily)
MCETTPTTATADAPFTCSCNAESTQRRPNEVDLVTRLQARDETAFREIVERYGSAIHHVSYGILGNRDDADEIAQEVFAKVHFAIHRFIGRSSLYSWIYRIAVNECYAVLRKKRVKLVYPSDSQDDALTRRMDSFADGCPTPDRTAMHRDFINKLLAHISDDDRWLLVSKEVEGFSLPELSQMTGLNVPTIKSRLFRARQNLVAAAARTERHIPAPQNV